LENVPAVRAGVEAGNVRFGTIDSWVIYNLTGEFVTDASNASRTYLCSLAGEWDEELLAVAGLDRKMLPRIVDSFSAVGKIGEGPLAGAQICAILGDQQSSAYAHELRLNEAKITYGTGCFLLASIGPRPAIHSSFVTTIMYKQGEEVQYGFECSVECGGGTLNWARRAGFFSSYNELNTWEDISGESLYFFPSFGEVYAPFWKTGVQGGLVGLNLSTSRGQIVAALLESILFRVKDNLK
jgi:glycerol kinase